MVIQLKAIGDLRDYIGQEPQAVELKENATLADLLAEIDVRWGKALPQYLWDSSQKKFRGAVFFLINEEVVKDLQTPLQDGLRIDLLKAIVGG